MKNYFQHYILCFSCKNRDTKIPDEHFSWTTELVKFYPRLTQNWRSGCCVSSTWIFKLVILVVGVYIKGIAMWLMYSH